jgi:hypothetical protein
MSLSKSSMIFFEKLLLETFFGVAYVNSSTIISNGMIIFNFSSKMFQFLLLEMCIILSTNITYSFIFLLLFIFKYDKIIVELSIEFICFSNI